MTEISKKQMVERVKQQKESYVMDAELRGDHSENYERDIAMYDAILAALDEKGGVSEEERKELLQYFNTMDEIVQKHSPVGKALKKLGVRIPTARTDQIRALIMGKGA